MVNFCTLFNSNYLARGLVMYDSLVKNCTSFHLYIFAFDDRCYRFLSNLKLKDLTVISLKEFEDEELLRIKESRTPTEYCWTCTPSTILYCIKRFGLTNCTYIDADLMFYSDPKKLINELSDNSVLITEHRYTPGHDLTSGSGKYCVQFVTFINDERGIKTLSWWRDACIDWCYNRYEDGKFGDQKYLDDWTTRFEGVHELQHLGGGLAPWNIQQYSFSIGSELIGIELNTGNEFEVVFFHFHSLKFYDRNIVAFTDPGYDLKNEIKSIFYIPYIKLLQDKANEIKRVDPTLSPNGNAGKAPLNPLNMIQLIKFYWYDIKQSPKNILAPNMVKRIRNHHFHYINKL